MLLLLQMCGFQVPLSLSDAMFAAQTFMAEFPAAKPVVVGAFALLSVFLLLAFGCWLTMGGIRNNAVGVVERLWSLTGSVTEGRIVALNREAGFPAACCAAGSHWGAGAQPSLFVHSSSALTPVAVPRLSTGWNRLFSSRI